MTCAEREFQIALYAGGELQFDEVEELESHLELCEVCRKVQIELAAVCVELIGLRHVNPAFAAEARHGALRSLRWQRARPWAALGAIAAALFVVTPSFLSVMTVPPPPSVSKIAYVIPEFVRTVAKPQVRRMRISPAIKAKAEPMLVKIYTDDPDVVILWITD